MATKQSRWHGRVEGARANCAVPGCGAAGRVQGTAAAGQFRRAGGLAVPVPRPCPRAQREVQFLRGHERGRNPARAIAARRLGAAKPALRGKRWRPAAQVERLRRSARCHLGAGSAVSASARGRRASARKSGARCPCSVSATMPIVIRCASAIRNSYGAITRTKTAATARTRASSAR